jgi:phosphoribosylglycinamide formyltransferase-1
MFPSKQLKILVLASGGATDMEPIARLIKREKLSASILELISDNPEGYALTRARKYGIPAALIRLEGKTKNERNKFNAKIIDEVEKCKPDLILLLGWMKILGKKFVRRYRAITWNIHPALLPMYAGEMDKAVHEAILLRGAQLTGCSLIQIDEGPDTGPIIGESIVRVRPDDTVETLRARVQKAEQRLILKNIRLFMEGRLKVTRNKLGAKIVIVLPKAK